MAVKIQKRLTSGTDADYTLHAQLPDNSVLTPIISSLLPATGYTFKIELLDSNNTVLDSRIVISTTDSTGSVSLGLSLSTSPTTTVGGSDGSITATATGGTAPYEFKLGAGAYSTNNIFNNLTSGYYTVTTKDAVNATVSESVTVAEVINATPGSYIVMAEGTSRVADDRGRTNGGGPQIVVYGTANPWLERLKTRMAARPEFVKFDNWATAGDEIESYGMLHAVELDELESSMEAGKVNILFLHHYINNINARVNTTALTATEIADEVKASIQTHLTAVNARATALGAELRIVMLTEPSARLAAWTEAQLIKAQEAIEQVRTWLLANYQSLGVLVVADLYSESRFAEISSTYFSPFFYDGIHYTADAHQYIVDTFVEAALEKAAQNVPSIIQAVDPAQADPLVLTSYDDNDGGNIYVGFDEPSFTGVTGYHDLTAKGASAGVLSATIQREFSFAGTPEEYLEIYGYLPNTYKASVSVNGSAFVPVPVATYNVPTPIHRIEGLYAGNHTVIYKFEKVDGTAFDYGAVNFDRWLINSRVNIVINPLQYETVEDSDSRITFTGFNAPLNAGAPYSDGTTRQATNDAGSTAAISTTVTGTLQEGVEFYAYTNYEVALEYRVNGGSWVTVSNTTGTTDLNVPAIKVMGLAAGTHLVEAKFSGNAIFGKCNFDRVRLITR